MKTTLYLDGFNLFYRALKGTPLRWLNPIVRVARAFPRNQICATKYFTAKASALPANPGQPIRKALLAGLQPDQLPMATASSADDMFSAVYLDSPSFYADLHGSSETVRGWVADILNSLQARGKVSTVRIETKNGSVIDIPGTVA